MVLIAYLEEGWQVAAFCISPGVAVSKCYENVGFEISQPSFEPIGGGNGYRIAQCSRVTTILWCL